MSRLTPTSSTGSLATQPLSGVAELVWNALDAEAGTVTIEIARNDLDGVEAVVITDDGHGMTNATAVRDFKRLGGSWKKSQALSMNGGGVSTLMQYPQIL